MIYLNVASIYNESFHIEETLPVFNFYQTTGSLLSIEYIFLIRNFCILRSKRNLRKIAKVSFYSWQKATDNRGLSILFSKMFTQQSYPMAIDYYKLLCHPFIHTKYNSVVYHDRRTRLTNFVFASV